MKEYKKQFHIRFTILNFTIRFLQNCLVPADKASAIRGGLGNGLLQVNCVNKGKKQMCEECTLHQSCIVQKIMYAPLRISLPFVTTGESEGYIISCDNKRMEFKKGETLSFSITLFGDVISYFPYVLQSMFWLAEQGLGKERARFDIIAAKDFYGRDLVTGTTILLNRFPVTYLDDYIQTKIQRYNLKSLDSCKITFYSPLALKYQGNILQEFHAGAFLNGLGRRVYIMNCFEGNEETYWRKWKDGTYFGCFSGREQQGMTAVEEETELLPELTVRRLYGRKVKRYSMKQKKKMVMYGIEGEFLLSGVTEEMVWYLLAGEILHVGKYTSFGFGKYCVRKI